MMFLGCLAAIRRALAARVGVLAATEAKDVAYFAGSANLTAPQAKGAPTISGPAQQGATLTSTLAAWSETPYVQPALPTNNYAPVIVGTAQVGQVLTIKPEGIDPAALATTADKTFEDEFAALSLWNGVSGTWNTSSAWDTAGGYTLTSNSEAQWYIDSRNPPPTPCTPWTVAGGELSLTADLTAAGNLGYTSNQAWTSGQLNTFHSFSQLYGYFEASLQMPAGKALWPAFWLLPTSRAWPPEIDIVEFVNDVATKFYATTHSTSADVKSSVTPDNGVDLTAGFHTYGLLWTASTCEIFFDGVSQGTLTVPADFTDPAYIILNLAVGGPAGWVGQPDGTTPHPASLKAQWVRAWKAKPRWVDADTVTGQWYADAAPIAGATGLSLTLTAAEQGKAITYGEVGHNTAGASAEVLSTATSAVAAAPSGGDPGTGGTGAATWDTTAVPSNVTLSNGNLTATWADWGDDAVRATSGYDTAVETASRAFSITCVGGAPIIGLWPASADLTTGRDWTYAKGAAAWNYRGFQSSAGGVDLPASYGAGDVVTIRVAGGQAWLALNGGTEVGPIDVSMYGTVYPILDTDTPGVGGTADFSSW